jgi:hypothetical protein
MNQAGDFNADLFKPTDRQNCSGSVEQLPLNLKLHGTNKITTNTSKYILFTIKYLVLKLDRLLVGKPEGKRPQGRRRRRWVDNIKMYVREMG